VVRIGTRGSPLALYQAHHVRDLVLAAHGWPVDRVEIVTMRTSGDRIQDRPLSEVGGKGLFTKELEEGLLAGSIDLAVHSMKDVATELPDRLTIACVLEREDPRDAFISLLAPSFTALPRGAVVGTSSLRRQAQVLRQRPDVTVISFRGNVETRLRKLGEGQAAATFLAMAGLKRLGMTDRVTAAIETDDMLPAVAQGAIGIEIRRDDPVLAEILQPLNHAVSAAEVAAERALLARLEGSCRTPIAALARVSGDRLVLRAEVLSPDGSRCVDGTLVGTTAESAALGATLGEEIAGRAGPDLLARG
jgi:hydroxymethylbilane synthase